MSSSVGASDFKERLVALCVGGRDWPRAAHDRHILLKSMSLMLEAGRTYTESELNERLRTWLTQVGRTIRLDHVTLRRYLVDARYVNRDAAGRAYVVNVARAGAIFEPEVETIDPVAVVEEALLRKEEQKRAYRSEKRGK